MIAFIGQILGCLLVAAGIGGVVGWLLRQLSPGRSHKSSRTRHRSQPQRSRCWRRRSMS